MNEVYSDNACKYKVKDTPVLEIKKTYVLILLFGPSIQSV